MTMKTLLLRAASIGAIAMALGACTTQSGVTYDIRAVSIPGKPDNVFRVSCDGLLGSANACARAAEEFCQGKGFTPIEMIDRVYSRAPMKDPRVQSNPGYLAIILLSRVVTRLGDLPQVNPRKAGPHQPYRPVRLGR